MEKRHRVEGYQNVPGVVNLIILRPIVSRSNITLYNYIQAGWLPFDRFGSAFCLRLQILKLKMRLVLLEEDMLLHAHLANRTLEGVS